MSNEKPIIFSAPMVLAILEGRKTQTRRVFEGTTEHKGPYNPDYLEVHKHSDGWEKICPYGKIGDELWVRENFRVLDACAGFDRGGDDWEFGSARLQYPADGATKDVTELGIRFDGVDEGKQALRAMKKKTVPSIHMPRWASRIQLGITNIRIEHLQDIDEGDSLCEGIEYTRTGDHLEGDLMYHCKNYMATGKVAFSAADNPDLDADILDTELAIDPQESFKSLWQSINGPESWDLNPWVWVVDFEVLKK